MTHRALSPVEIGREYALLQAEVDALLDLPDDNDPNGPIGAEDEYFHRGQQFVTLMYTGSYYLVREYMRETVKPYADLTLDLADCLHGMTTLRDDLRAMDADELAKTVVGAFDARRAHNQRIAKRRTARAGRKPKSAPKARSTRRPAHQPVEGSRSDSLPDGVPFGQVDRQFGFRLQTALTAIERLRDPQASTRAGTGSCDNDPTTARKFRFIARAWAVYYVTGLMHQTDTTGTLMVGIADPDLSAEDCIRGLSRIERKIRQLSPMEREFVFTAMDDAYVRSVPRLAIPGS